MKEIHQIPNSFSQRLFHSLVFGCPSGASLALLYHFAWKLTGQTALLEKEDFVHQAFILILNCTLLALSPLLFCLYEIYSLATQISQTSCYDKPIALFTFFGIVPLLVYIFYAYKKGWFNDRSLWTIDFAKMKQAIAIAILAAVLVPFSKQILDAPANMMKSFRLIVVLAKYNSTGDTPEHHAAGRSVVEAFSESGKTPEALDFLSRIIDKDLHDRHDPQSTIEDLSCLSKIDPAHLMPKQEWVSRCRSIDQLMTEFFSQAAQSTSSSKYSNLDAWHYGSVLFEQYSAHHAYEEALTWRRRRAIAERSSRGAAFNYALVDLAYAYHDAQDDKQALELLQKCTALCECDDQGPIRRFDITDAFSSAWRNTLTLSPDKIDNALNKAIREYWKRPAAKLYQEANDYVRTNQLWKALPLLEKAQRLDNQVHLDSTTKAVYQGRLAKIYEQLGDNNKAETLYRQALANHRHGNTQNNPDIAAALNNLALCLRKQNKNQEVESILLEAVQRDQVLGPFSYESRTVRGNLINFYLDQHQFEKVEVIYKQNLLALSVSKADEQNKVTSFQEYQELGDLYILMGRFDEAEIQYSKALEIAEHMNGPESHMLTASLTRLGNVYLYQKKYVEAEVFYKRAMQLHKPEFGELELAKRMDKFTELYTAQKQLDKAIALSHQTLETRKRLLTDDYYDLCKNRTDYKALLEAEKKVRMRRQ